MRNSNFISFRLRKIIEKINIKKLLGFQLTLTIFLNAAVLPKLNTLFSVIAVSRKDNNPVITQNITKTNFRWPLDNFRVSQKFRFYHPAVDLTGKKGTLITSIGDGIVEKVVSTRWGYGKHVIVRHEQNGYFSLYAHLEEVFVRKGDKIEQGTPLGTVGITGWTTGPHLHLEIRGPEGRVNPFDVLPKIDSLTNLAAKETKEI